MLLLYGRHGQTLGTQEFQDQVFYKPLSYTWLHSIVQLCMHVSAVLYTDLQEAFQNVPLTDSILSFLCDESTTENPIFSAREVRTPSDMTQCTYFSQGLINPLNTKIKI